MSDTPTIAAGVPEDDGCPVLTKLKAFLVDQGVIANLEHTFRDRSGNIIDLSAYVSDSDSASLSTSGNGPTGSIVLRIREWLGVGRPTQCNPIWESTGISPDPTSGLVQAQLPSAVTDRPGIYTLNWAVLNSDGDLILMDRGIASVESSLFAGDLDRLGKGPPTIQELRMRLRDSSASQNLLLDDVEFDDDDILLALVEPVRTWNESPPPIQRYTTSNFPYHGAWIEGAIGQLHFMAANRYRRNRLAHSAGGVTVDDLNKEKEYLAEGQRRWDGYRQWLANEKMVQNARRFAGSNVSPYSRWPYW